MENYSFLCFCGDISASSWPRKEKLEGSRLIFAEFVTWVCTGVYEGPYLELFEHEVFPSLSLVQSIFS